MGKMLTKEEFLDKRNAKLIREVRDVFELKNQLEKLNRYLQPLYKDGLLCRFKTGHEESKKMGLTYSCLDLLVSMVEEFKNKELMFVEHGKLTFPKDLKECYTEPKAVLYFRDKEGNWYDSEYNPIDEPKQ